jgi:hypothetical protein
LLTGVAAAPREEQIRKIPSPTVRVRLKKLRVYFLFFLPHPPFVV